MNEFEKKYKDALGWMRDVYPTLTGATKEDAEHYFPELKDSEDERIRKRLIEYFEGFMLGKANVFWEGLRVEDILAWLENHKEQTGNKAPTFDDYLKATPSERRKMNMGEILGKKELWEPEYREEDMQTRFAFYTYKDEPGVLYLSNLFVEEASRNAGFGTRILHAAEKVAETIGASSIRLKVKRDSPANAWYRKRGYRYMAFEDGHDWLEKRLEYLKPGNQADWSETDDRMIGGIRSILEQHAIANNAVDVNGELCEGEYIEMDLWLQSLSSRLKLDDRFMEGYHKGQADAEASYNKRVSYHVDCPRYTETRNTK